MFSATLQPTLPWTVTDEAFVQVSLERHQDRFDKAFREAVLSHPEIVGCYVMTGEMDYLLHILARDLEAYGRFTLDC